MTDDRPPERDPDADLSPSERFVLHVLRERGGELSLSTLRDTTGLPDRTARDAAERLEAKELLEREKCSEDPRRYRWALAT